MNAVASPSEDDDMVHVEDVIVIMGGNIDDENGIQAGINLININPAIRNAQVLFEPIPTTATFSRRGISAEDTRLMFTEKVTFAVTKTGFRREQDVQEYYTFNKLDYMRVFSGPNRYIAELAGKPVIEPYDSNANDDLLLDYVMVGKSTTAPDVGIVTDISAIDTFTQGGGNYQASALQLNQTCEELVNGNYNPSHPFPGHLRHRHYDGTCQRNGFIIHSDLCFQR